MVENKDWLTGETFPCVPGVVHTVPPVASTSEKALKANGVAGSLDKQLEQIDTVLEHGDKAQLDDLVARAQQWVFRYKGRRCVGGALHIAVQHPEGSAVVHQLLKLSADIREECRYMSFDKVATAQPVHLAVQSGQTEIVQAMLGAKADIDAKAKRDGHLHFTPLHEAAFFRHANVACFLLEAEADVNAQNLEGMSPLHVAAKTGAADVAETLVQHDADIEMKDTTSRTALKVAVESGVFPHRRLHLLARWRIGDIMVVAEHYPSAVAAFMRDLSRDVSIGMQAAHKTTTVARLQQEERLTVAHWIELMDEAPEAGQLLLEYLTVEPDEDSVFYHPLPTQACVTELQCEYNQDETWRCDTETANDRSKAWPDWHDRLAPGSDTVMKRTGSRRGEVGVALVRGLSSHPSHHAKSELNPVHIRQLRLPGMVCPEVFHVLAETPHLDIFKNAATQSVLQIAWLSFVRRHYSVQLLHRIGEIVVLVVWTFYELSWEEGAPWSGWKRRACWSFVFVSSLRETLREFSEAYSYIFSLRDPRSYFMNFWNYLDLATIGLFNAFSWGSMRGSKLNGDPRIFSGVALFRWIQLLYTFRAYNLGKLGIGGIIPILHSLKEIGGMLIICVFTFIGFTHAFLALDQNPDDWEATVVNTFRLLFLGDGDGIDAVLQLGSYESAGLNVTFFFLVLAVFVFCISLLNLFIAVHGEAYAQARRDSVALHLQERASICLHCMMQPEWPLPWRLRRRLGCLGDRLRMPTVSCILLLAVAVGAWCGLLAIEGLHPAGPSLLLLAASWLGNCFLCQRPWPSEPAGARSFVWWCAPVHRKQESQGPDLESLGERLSYLENSIESLLAEVKKGDTAGRSHDASGTIIPSSPPRATPKGRGIRRRTKFPERHPVAGRRGD